MRVKQLLLSLFLCAALLLPNTLQARCAVPAFSLTAEEPSAGPNGELKISLFINEELPEEIAAFQFSLHYDASRLLYKGILEGTVSDGELKTEQQGGDITGIYLDSAQDGKSIKGCLLTLSFRVLGTAAPGPADFSAQVYDVTGWSEKMLTPPQNAAAQAQLLPPPSDNALLLALEPSAGSLSPDFSPGCFDYTLNVPEGTASVLFSAQAQEADASVRVDRKNIKSGAQPTVITVTVTAPDGATKQAYRVSVSRLQNGGGFSSAASSPSQAAAGTNNTAGSGRTDTPSAQNSPARPANHTGGTVPGAAVPETGEEPEVLPTGAEAQIQPPGARQAGIRPGALMIRGGGFEAFLYGIGVAALAAALILAVLFRSQVIRFIKRILKLGRNAQV